MELEGALLSGPLKVKGRFPVEAVWPDSVEFTLGEPENPGLAGLVPGLWIGDQRMWGDWDGERWRWNWRASGVWDGPVYGLPESEGSELPWSLEAMAGGDLKTILLEEGYLDLQLLELRLLSPLEIPLAEADSNGVAELAGFLDLDHPLFELLPVDGKADFQVQFRSRLNPAGEPRLDFEGNGRRVTAGGKEIGIFGLSGFYEGHRLRFERGEWSQGGSVLKAGGAIDLAGDPTLKLSFDGAFKRADFPLLFTFLPEMESIAGEGEGSGTFSDPVVSGRFSGRGLRLPGMEALDVHLSLADAGLEGGRFSLKGEAEGRAIALSGTLTKEGEDRLRLLLSEARLETPGEPTLLLVEAGRLVFLTGKEGEPLRIELDGGLALESKSGKNAIQLKLLQGSYRVGDYPRHLELTARGLNSAWVDPWVEEVVPVFGINGLEVRTGEAPYTDIQFSGSGRYETGILGGVEVVLKARTSENNLLIETLSLKGEGSPILVETRGRLPLRMGEGSDRGGLPALDPKGTLQLEGRIQSGGPPVSWTAGGMEFQIGEVVADYRVEGPLEALEGHFATRGNQFLLETERWDHPLRLEGWDVEGAFRDELLVLKGKALKLMETRLDVEATLPVPQLVKVLLREEDWQVLRAGSTVKVESPEVNLSDWAEFLPAGILPSGSARVDLTYREKRGLRGVVGFRGLSTAVGGSGVALREVEGTVRFKGFEGVLEPTRLLVGGRPAELTGDWSWNIEAPSKTSFRVDFSGEGLPLVRQADLLLRSDVDLRLERGEEGGAVRLSGRLGLRDGLFLQDFLGFIQPGTTTAMRRPPYFQVTAKPFASWELDVALEGERFLRVNAPVARGTLSADLELRGTLETPYLLGMVTLDEGSLQLPFGRVKAESGQAEFTLVQPYDPEILVTGVSNTVGYRVDVRVGGRLSSPEIELESNPALTNDEVILLLTAGIIPDTNFKDSLSSASSRLALYLGRGILGDLLGYSAAERLRVRYGEYISESGLETYQLEYDLRKDLSIIGEYDKYDHYNLDLRYRLGGGGRR